MKKLFLSLITALSLFSCSQSDVVNTDVENEKTEVVDEYKYMSFKPTFDIEVSEAKTRSIESGSAVYIKAYDIYDGNVINVVDGGQITFPNFPNISFKSKYGTHKFVFIVSAKQIIDNSYPIDFEKRNDILLGEMTIDIDANTKAMQNVSLNRITSKLVFKLLDDPTLAQDLAKIVITNKSSNYLLNILSDKTTLVEGGDMVANITATSAASVLASSGELNISVYIMTLDDENKLMNSIIQFLDSNGNTLASYDLNSVPYRRNNTTTISGKFLGSSSSFGFSYDIEWKEDKDLNFGIGDYVN